MKFTSSHLAAVTLISFWFGVGFTVFILNTLKENCQGYQCLTNKIKEESFIVKIDPKYNSIENNNITKFVTRKQNYEKDHLNTVNTKTIYLHDKDVWNKYDLWQPIHWSKCPPKASKCRITTDPNQLESSDAVVYNSLKMPSIDQIDNIKAAKFKRVFLSGQTPTQSSFNPKNFDGFFDLTITYKDESDIRIPYWPNDGILPSMYRPKRIKGAEINNETLLEIEDEVKSYFSKFGKDQFMAFTIKNCSQNLFSNMFVKKLREEGNINIYSLVNQKECLQMIIDTTVLPCKNFDWDDCVKHFERVKFVITPDEDLCIDYTTRDYWKAILAWNAVPLLYGAGNYKKHLIPNSYIDTVANEDYISPSFQKAYGPSQDDLKYYKTFHLWRHEDRVEEYYWQCELCDILRKEKVSKKVKMSEFWDKDKNCGKSLDVYEKMRLQLVRTGVIR
ncbi:3-galactosyl-N-acetylglucosaminide 4-alpha-L-fucosyltransferase FUT3-like [Hydra vulgaris]|uniref:3-galactosyl-N-acetylglucosaminide 4-alpha-L-fucosyltransferase FUT3-like n=1 Tax=Hydra vulgaris TaxID=6087 RepID=A0ABM4D0P9_HYDVU